MNNEILIYQTEGNDVEVRLDADQETIWLTQKQMSDLFDKDSDTIGLHLKFIYASSELERDSTTEDYSVVRQEDSRQVNRRIRHYNLCK